MIYWDHNASTPLHPEVAALLERAYRAASESPGNAASVHAQGRRARARLDDARAKVASILHCEPKEVCFTASGSEADAIAVRGVYAAVQKKQPQRRKVVTTAIEHPAVQGSCRQLSSLGAQLLTVKPGPDGVVPLEALIAELDEQTAVCSVMWANNETGVLQPVAEVARACRERGVRFHVDAVQAAGKVPVALTSVDADLLSLSAHKFGGPVGAGVLIVRRGVEVEPLIPGHQELGRRGGTQDVAHAEAFALALELAAKELEQNGRAMAALRDAFESKLMAAVPNVRVNGGGAPRVPNTSNVLFEGADGEALLIALDLEGICVSTGAACASGSLTPSHVLTSMGLTPRQASGTLRFSLGRSTTREEVDRVLAALERHVPAARKAASDTA